MTDTTGFIANPVALSDDLHFKLKPSAVSSRTYRCSVPTANKSSFNPGDLAIAYIPARRNCFLDISQSYLRMTYKNNETISGNYMTLDSCGACAINRLDVFSGSNLCETISQYNVLYNYLLDSQLNMSERVGLSAAYGTCGYFNNEYSGRNGAQIAAKGLLTTCMPILSGLVGCLAEKYLPLSLADDIRLEFTLEQNNLAVVYASGVTLGSTWSIINMELELCIIEMSSEGMHMIEDVSPFSQPIYLHASSYRHFTSTLATAQTGQITHLVPARFASLKSMHCLPRRATEVASSSSYSLSSRINPLITAYQWRIGSLLVPQKQVNLKNVSTTGGYAEGFMEWQRAWHATNHAEYAGSCGSWSYNVGDVADTTIGDGGTTTFNTNTPSNFNSVQGPFTGVNSYQNGFCIAQELEVFAMKNNSIMQGVNTLGAQTYFEFQVDGVVNSGGGVSATYTFDYYAFFDCVFILADGLISVKF